MKAQNFDKLPEDALLLIAMFFETIQALPYYMIEVNLSDPVRYLYSGGDGMLITHAGSGGRHHAKHAFDSKWAVIHIDDEDVSDFDWSALALKGLEKLSEWEALYNEAGNP